MALRSLPRPTHPTHPPTPVSSGSLCGPPDLALSSRGASNLGTQLFLGAVCGGGGLRPLIRAPLSWRPPVALRSVAFLQFRFPKQGSPSRGSTLAGGQACALISSQQTGFSICNTSGEFHCRPLWPHSSLKANGAIGGSGARYRECECCVNFVGRRLKVEQLFTALWRLRRLRALFHCNISRDVVSVQATTNSWRLIGLGVRMRAVPSVLRMSLPTCGKAGGAVCDRSENITTMACTIVPLQFPYKPLLPIPSRPFGCDQV